MKIEGFDWDNGNKLKVQKHGVTIDEIEVFLLNNPIIYLDRKNSHDEIRYIAFDYFGNKLLFISFTIRKIDGVHKVRVISARYAHKKEWDKFYGKI